MSLIPYFLIGSAFGAVLMEAEVISWFRIQEMFRGTIFGLGRALTGACPGPLVALIGGGVPVMVLALAGTWLYGLLRPRLPH